MKNLEIYDKFRVVPAEAKKEIGAGRLKGFTDINPMWRIKMLTEQFGVCGFGWYTEIVEQKIEIGSDGQKAAFVTINLFVKYGDVWSKPIVGVGGSSFVTNESKGAYTSDECFKMAYTDALSIACKSLGMGADVYFAKDRTKYDQQGQTQTAPPKPQPAPPKPQPAPLTPEQQQLMNEYNELKAKITAEIIACKDAVDLQIIVDSYPQFAKIGSFKKMLTDKYESFK